MNWRKSSRSNSNPGHCVEVARTRDVLVRDSKNPDGPRLTFGERDWDALVADIKEGRCDLLR